MSYMMCARITFPKTMLETYMVNEVKIVSSWKTLTDTAVITLPCNAIYHNGHDLEDVIAAGDPVIIELGYDANFIREFEGYIVTVNKGSTIIIDCEDEMYQLKRRTVSYSKKNVTLKQLLSDIAPEYELQTSFGDTCFGTLRYSDKKVSEILEELSKTGLYTYFIGKKLCCGDVYSDKVKYATKRVEVERDVVSQKLKSTNGEYNVVAFAALPDGKKIEAKIGTFGTNTFNIRYNGQEKKVTPKALQDFAQQFRERLKDQKYKGSITLFGIPSVAHNMVVDVNSVITPHLNGKYHVEKVSKEFSNEATYRQEIELGGWTE